MSTDLKQKTISGIIWRGLETVGTRGVQFVVSIVLARLLLVEEFGLIAMLLIFTQLAQAFIASGFPNALIQKKDVTFTDECSVFYFNIFIAAVMYWLIFFVAPSVAAFYDQPLLCLILRVISINLVIGSFAQIQQTLLAKKMDFKSQLKVGWTSIIVSGVVGVAMAYKGFGVWALVGQQITVTAMRTIMLWIVSPWRPGFVFCFKSLKSMFSFGSKILFSGLLQTFFDNIYMVVIGKIYSTVDLGLYNRGKSLPNLLMSSVNATVAAVMFPAYSMIQDDEMRLKFVAKRSLKTLCMVIMPLMAGMLATAEPLVKILITDKWLPCVPYLRIMCLVYATWPIHTVNLQLIMAIGRSDIVLKLEIIKKIIIVLMILITFKFGILAMVAGQLVTAILSAYLNTHYSGKFVNYPTLEQLKDLLPVIGVTTVMGTAVFFVGRLGFGNVYFQFAVQIACGILIYIAGCIALKIDGLYEVIAIIKQKLR